MKFLRSLEVNLKIAWIQEKWQNLYYSFPLPLGRCLLSTYSVPSKAPVTLRADVGTRVSEEGQPF